MTLRLQMMRSMEFGVALILLLSMMRTNYFE
jgi:hypothetical protein